ncbi:MAG TPA: hypothetical protein VHD36_02340 [Pirellulales bacterium]|nr:hypothetical protein [Pirellulales bacterium]
MFRAIKPGERATRAALFLAMVGELSVLSSHSALAQAPAASDATPPGEGRLYNLMQRPFVVQLHRADGVKWSDGFVIQPGKFYAVRVPRPGERSDIMGLSGNGQGFVIVRFKDPKLGGFRTLRLTATNANTMKLEPNWFAVEDSNGIINLLQNANLAEAKAAQENLLKEPAMTPAELQSMKRTLRANYVLTD